MPPDPIYRPAPGRPCGSAGSEQFPERIGLRLGRRRPDFAKCASYRDSPAREDLDALTLSLPACGEQANDIDQVRVRHHNPPPAL